MFYYENSQHIQKTQNMQHIQHIKRRNLIEHFSGPKPSFRKITEMLIKPSKYKEFLKKRIQEKSKCGH